MIKDTFLTVVSFIDKNVNIVVCGSLDRVLQKIAGILMCFVVTLIEGNLMLRCNITNILVSGLYKANWGTHIMLTNFNTMTPFQIIFTFVLM